jgi:hypothetical protein
LFLLLSRSDSPHRGSHLLHEPQPLLLWHAGEHLKPLGHHGAPLCLRHLVRAATMSFMSIAMALTSFLHR